MMKRIEAVIDLEGQVKIDVQGAVGKECEELTEELEQALGTVTTRQRTREFYQQAQTQQQQAKA
jgi:Protein of unknown function (DUF2997)